jgi:hypothetical protein
VQYRPRIVAGRGRFWSCASTERGQPEGYRHLVHR